MNETNKPIIIGPERRNEKIQAFYKAMISGENLASYEEIFGPPNEVGDVTGLVQSVTAELVHKLINNQRKILYRQEQIMKLAASDEDLDALLQRVYLLEQRMDDNDVPKSRGRKLMDGLSTAVKAGFGNELGRRILDSVPSWIEHLS